MVSFNATVDGYTVDASSLLYDGCGTPPGSAFICDATYGPRGNLQSLFLSAYATNFLQLDFVMFPVLNGINPYELYITGGPMVGLVDRGSYSFAPEPSSFALMVLVSLIAALTGMFEWVFLRFCSQAWESVTFRVLGSPC
jgi:hypothetical protein